MSVRVVARIRPLLDGEVEKDVIVRADSKDGSKKPNVVKVPNPKNESEDFNFSFGGVYDQSATQEALFTAEGTSTFGPFSALLSPHMKALFQGLDVTIFAYGVTGTGKTHTMRGGLKLADRGLIPRLLSNVFRRGKKAVKDSNEATTVDVSLSYYEIYNDKVFDLLLPPERRTPSGLPLREANGKTIVVGLSEQPCEDLKDFEKLYIEANNNRITAATKLNAHSSRSHAILRVKVTQTTGDQMLESTVSMIDLAGSEDNRRTENNRERLVESAAINKSLFVLSQCVDAISRGDKRIPYRESKMTRILSLGQNNGITVMILNLAPVRSYHLDTLSSLNVSSRAKRIEVREIENEIVFKQAPRSMTLSGTGIQRQPLKPLTNAHNVHAGTMAKEKAEKEKAREKPLKAFSVFVDRKTAVAAAVTATMSSQPRNALSSKRKSDSVDATGRPSKIIRPATVTRPQSTSTSQSLTMSAAQIEEMVERKVQEILASRATTESQQQEEHAPAVVPAASAEISEAVQRRLDALERRIEDTQGEGAGGKSEGMRLLLQARKFKEKGDDEATLKCYESALRYFPRQPKLLGKIEKLKAKIAGKGANVNISEQSQEQLKPISRKGPASRQHDEENAGVDPSYIDGDAGADADESYVGDAPVKSQPSSRAKASSPHAANVLAQLPADDPRTHQLLEIVNSRDVNLIKGLRGFGTKKAQSLVTRLNGIDYSGTRADQFKVDSLVQLSGVFGMGEKVVEKAWEALGQGTSGRSLGGSIGSGLFIASSTGLQQGGPAGLFFAFVIVGVAVWLTMCALAELSASFPVQGSFYDFSIRFISPSWGFAMGWNYNINFMLIVPYEVTVIILIEKYWDAAVPDVALVPVFIVGLFAVHIFGAKAYAEVERALGIAKIIVLVMFTITGCIIAGGEGFISVFVAAGVAWGGTEMLGLTAAECKQPRRVMSLASMLVFGRLIICYLLPVFVVGLVLKPSAFGEPQFAKLHAVSPFVAAVQVAGIRVLPHVINAFLIAAVFSMGSSAFFASSRSLTAICKQGMGPRIFAKTTKSGLPRNSLLAVLVVSQLAWVTATPKGSYIFEWLLALSSTSNLFTWLSICVCHISVREDIKEQYRRTSSLVWRSPTGVFGSYLAAVIIVGCMISMVASGIWKPVIPTPQPHIETAMQKIIGFIVVFVFWVGHLLIVARRNNASWRERLVIPLNQLALPELDATSRQLPRRSAREKGSNGGVQA
ncbi:hypothetical protein diail_483 [Diaporthe ilicicola]|nr:hypothetical protein diail_483 [Diaporthe ilicicola]